MGQINRSAFDMALRKAGISQNKAADMIGLSRNSLSRKVLGKRDFRLQEVKKLCRLLNIEDPREIFFPEMANCIFEKKGGGSK